jgi:hypothetical protein
MNLKSLRREMSTMALRTVKMRPWSPSSSTLARSTRDERDITLS